MKLALCLGCTFAGLAVGMMIGQGRLALGYELDWIVPAELAVSSLLMFAIARWYGRDVEASKAKPRRPAPDEAFYVGTLDVTKDPPVLVRTNVFSCEAKHLTKIDMHEFYFDIVSIEAHEGGGYGDAIERLKELCGGTYAPVYGWALKYDPTERAARERRLREQGGIVEAVDG